MNTAASTKHEWKGGTKIHVQRRRQLKSTVMNNALIMLEKYIRHKLNSSEPNKCNNYDMATQWKTTDGYVRLLCRCALNNSHMRTYMGLHVPACIHLRRAGIACGASYLILPRGNTASPPCLFLPPHFELKLLLEMQSDWAQHVLKGGQRAGKTVWCHGNLMPRTKNLEWQLGPSERLVSLSWLTEDGIIYLDNWTKHRALKNKIFQL